MAPSEQPEGRALEEGRGVEEAQGASVWDRLDENVTVDVDAEEEAAWRRTTQCPSRDAWSAPGAKPTRSSAPRSFSLPFSSSRATTGAQGSGGSATRCGSTFARVGTPAARWGMPARAGAARRRALRSSARL